MLAGLAASRGRAVRPEMGPEGPGGIRAARRHIVPNLVISP